MLNSFLYFVGQEGRTSLYAACFRGHIDIVGLLITEGADKDQAMHVNDSKTKKWQIFCFDITNVFPYFICCPHQTPFTNIR